MVILKNVSNIYARSVVATVATVEEAKAKIPGEIVLIEEDADYPGFFDAFNSMGELFTIEPAEKLEE
jgi:hypothetical protein